MSIEESTSYLHRTHYSSHFTAWIKRIVLILALVLITLAWIFADDEYNSLWILFPLFILTGIGMLLSPVDDLAMDAHRFFHLKTSFLKFLSKKESFEISRIRSINSVTGNTAASDQDKYTTTIE